MNTLGDLTQTIFFKGFTGSNLFEEFVANAAIKAGQPVRLRTDGKVEAHVADDHEATLIGIAFADAAAGANVTVAMRGYGTIMAEGPASGTPGPVKWASFTSGTGLNRVAAAAVSTVYVAATSAGSPTTALKVMDPAMFGWALDASTSAGDQIRVVIRN